MLKWKPGPPPVQLEGEVVIATLRDGALPHEVPYSGLPVAIKWMRHAGKTTIGNYHIDKDDVAFHYVLKGKKAHV